MDPNALEIDDGEPPAAPDAAAQAAAGPHLSSFKPFIHQLYCLLLPHILDASWCAANIFLAEKAKADAEAAEKAKEEARKKQEEEDEKAVPKEVSLMIAPRHSRDPKTKNMVRFLHLYVCATLCLLIATTDHFARRSVGL